MSINAQSLKLLLVIVPMAFAFTACTGNSSGLYEVKGQLTHNGEPIPEINIIFVPEDTSKHPESYATTDAEGRFEMKVVNTPGVAPGKHTVFVQDPAAVQGGTTSSASAYQAVLKKYGDEESSPFTITVEENMSDLELKLD